VLGIVVVHVEDELDGLVVRPVLVLSLVDELEAEEYMGLVGVEDSFGCLVFVELEVEAVGVHEPGVVDELFDGGTLNFLEADTQVD